MLWLLHQLRWTDCWVFERQACGMHPLHFLLSHKCTAEGTPALLAARELVKILLEAYPCAAKHAVNDRMALHLAIENGWPCHDLLLAVYPEALNILDPKTELFPFQTAARAKEATCSMELKGLDVTYELLRANPTYAMQGARVGAQA